MLRTDVLDVLLERNVSVARLAREKLRRDYPDDDPDETIAAPITRDAGEFGSAEQKRLT